MKKQYLIYSGVLVLVAVGILLYQQVIKPQLDNRTVSVVVPMLIENEDLSFAFTYPSGEDAYSLIEPPLPPETSNGLKKAYLIMDTKAYLEYQDLDEASEAPPAVSVFVFERLDEVLGVAPEDSRAAKLEAWAKHYDAYTSFSVDKRTAEPEAITVDGVKGIRYETDGLYQQQIYLLDHQGNVYMFVGQYNEKTDATYSMFNDLMASVMFN